MRTLRLLARQIRYEQKLYWRSPSSAVFTFAFPILLLVIFATLNQGETIAALGGISYNQYYVPGIVAFSVISACYTNLAIGLCFRRDAGVLKRVRGTPLPPWVFMAGNIGSSLVVSVLLVALTTSAGVLLYDVDVPGPLGRAPVLTLAGGGVLLLRAGPGDDGGDPHGHRIPRHRQWRALPDPVHLRNVLSRSEPHRSWDGSPAFFPVRHFEQAMFAVFDPRETGSGIEAGPLLVMLGWGLAALIRGREALSLGASPGVNCPGGRRASEGALKTPSDES